LAERAGGAALDGMLVAQQVDGGVETVVGVSEDELFGPTVMFGLGGVFVEVLKDVALRVAPLTRADAEAMIREVKGFPLLDGARGRPKADVDALTDLVLKVSQMACELRGRVTELDLNPVRVRPVGQGVIALDALVVRSTGRPA
jgi:acyl-CoA synthetase (NDP forming)